MLRRVRVRVILCGRPTSHLLWEEPAPQLLMPRCPESNRCGGGTAHIYLRTVHAHDFTPWTRAQVMEEVGARPYVVVLFNADADLPAVPDATFMQELHTALDPAHRGRLKARPRRSRAGGPSCARSGAKHALNASARHLSKRTRRWKCAQVVRLIYPIAQ